MRKILSLLALVAMLLVATAVPGLAADADGQVVVDHSLQTVQVLSLIVGVFLPIAVAFVTKTVTSESTKAILLALFSAAAGLITAFINSPDGFDLFQASLTALTTFVVATATHFGLWKPTGVAAKVQSVGIR